jgi:hypothetical protein
MPAIVRYFVPMGLAAGVKTHLVPAALSVSDLNRAF